MLDTAFRDGVSVRQGVPGSMVVGGTADCGARGPELGLSIGSRLSAAAWLAAQQQAGVRLWRLNGLPLPPYRPRRKIRTGAKLDGPARHRNDVWAWDFVHDRYNDTEPLRGLAVKDEATGFCLAIETGRHLQHQHVKAVLKELITRFGLPKAIRTSNPASHGRTAAMKASTVPFAKNV